MDEPPGQTWHSQRRVHAWHLRQPQCNHRYSVEERPPATFFVHGGRGRGGCGACGRDRGDGGAGQGTGCVCGVWHTVVCGERRNGGGFWWTAKGKSVASVAGLMARLLCLPRRQLVSVLSRFKRYFSPDSGWSSLISNRSRLHEFDFFCCAISVSQFSLMENRYRINKSDVTRVAVVEVVRMGM